jgi:hypothetical protein
MEADVAALEMIFEQSQIFRLDVLENAQRFHDGRLVRSTGAGETLAPAGENIYRFLHMIKT